MNAYSGRSCLLELGHGLWNAPHNAVHLDFLQPNPCSSWFRRGDPNGHVKGIAMVSKDDQEEAIHCTMERLKIFQRGFVVLR